MYVCICHKITEKQLKETIKETQNIKAIQEKLNTGTDCGSCLTSLVTNYLNPHPSLSKKS